MKFTVCQTFETLGDPVTTRHETREAAEAAAAALRGQIAEMVAGWPTPEEEQTRTGFTGEASAWGLAESVAAVTYDDNGNRTEGSPATWGEVVGKLIAEKAVEIREEA